MTNITKRFIERYHTQASVTIKVSIIDSKMNIIISLVDSWNKLQLIYNFDYITLIQNSNTKFVCDIL